MTEPETKRGGGKKEHETHGDWILHKLIWRRDCWTGRIRHKLTGEVKYKAIRQKTEDEKKARQEVINWIRRLEREEEARMRAEREGKAPAPTARRFDDTFEAWLREKDCRETTLEAYWKDYAGAMPGKETKPGRKRAPEGVYKPEFGGRLLGEITKADIKAFLKKLKDEGRAVRTRAKHLTCLRSFFGWCLEEEQGYITRNPCAGRSLKAGKGPRRMGVALTPEEARKLIAAAGTNIVKGVKDEIRCGGEEWSQTFKARPYLPLAIHIALLTGLRQSNVLGLRWGDIDIGKRRIFIPAARMKGNADHEVPIHPELVEVFDGLLRGRGKVPAAEPVLGLELGEIKKSWKTALAKAGLPETTRWHDLRHSFGTWLIAREKTRRALMGHADESVTHRYQHPPWPEKVAAIEALPRLFGGKVEETKAKAE